jgi:hypothetical protein
LNVPRKHRFVMWIFILAGVFWSMTLGLGYALITYSDELTAWLNRVLGMPADIAQWLSAASVWLEQWGGWLLLVVWALGLVALFLLGWFASRIARHFPGPREGELT